VHPYLVLYLSWFLVIYNNRQKFYDVAGVQFE